MASCYQEWKAVCKKVEQSSLDEESRRRELSLAEFEVNEIEEAVLKEGEDEFLEEQYRKMTDSRKLTEGVAEAYQYTAEDERGNASDYLSRAIRSLQEAASFDEKGSQLYDQIVEIDSLLNDFNRDLAEYAKSFEYSEEEFSEVESRLNEVNHLKAKYGNTVSDILAYCEEKDRDYRNWKITILLCRNFWRSRRKQKSRWKKLRWNCMKCVNKTQLNLPRRLFIRCRN